MTLPSASSALTATDVEEGTPRTNAIVEGCTLTDAITPPKTTVTVLVCPSTIVCAVVPLESSLF